VLNNNLRDGEHSGQIVSIELAEREVEHARKMHHPNIVRLLDVFYSSPDKERLVIVVRGACGRLCWTRRACFRRVMCCRMR
jgi:serine/threonine protein kinase